MQISSTIHPYLKFALNTKLQTRFMKLSQHSAYKKHFKEKFDGISF